MQEMMTVTSVEWALIGLAGLVLVHTLFTCMQLRKDMVKADSRPAFKGLTTALCDVPKRAQLKAPKN